MAGVGGCGEVLAWGWAFRKGDLALFRKTGVSGGFCKGAAPHPLSAIVMLWWLGECFAYVSVELLLVRCGGKCCFRTSWFCCKLCLGLFARLNGS